MNDPIPTASGALPVHEFPDRLGAITVRELRAGLLGRDMVWLLIGVQVVLAIAGIYALQVSSKNPSAAHGTMQFAVWSCALIGLAVLSPLRALRALHGDRESRLLELLQLTPLSAGAIVFGKWVSLAVQAALFLVSLLPFFVLRYFLGGADLVGDANILLILFGFSVVAQSVFLLVSTFPRFMRGLALAGLFLILFSLLFSGRAMSGFGVFDALAHPFRNEGSDAYWILLYLVAQFVCVIGGSLSLAAQMIAAPAENYVGRTRLWFAGWVAVFVCLIRTTRMPPEWGEMAVIALVGVGIAAVLELGVERRLLPAHRPRRLLGRPFAWLLLPGWQSALLFHSSLVLALTVVAYALDGFQQALLVIPSAVALVLLPRAILVFLPWHWFGQRRLAPYALQLAFALLALGVAAGCGATSAAPGWPQFLPPLGFWNGLAWAKSGDWSPLPGACWAGVLLAVLIARALIELDAAFDEKAAKRR
ncbi:MAG TPA: hypothetical protein VK178_17185 [Opitutaceae bacterium]|nr:hypothetical protein [Opitutaceae bacterium]